MTQLTPMWLVKILGQVTVIMVVPMVGGAAAGISLDGMMGSSPLLFLVGFGAGNALSIAGIGLLIRSTQRKLRGGETRPIGTTRYDDA